MAISRVRISFSKGLANEAHCQMLWWPLPAPASPVRKMLSDVLSAVGLKTSVDAIETLLDNFSVLPSSSTALLRDGEHLKIELKGKRKLKDVVTMPAAGDIPAEKRPRIENNVKDDATPKNAAPIAGFEASGKRPSRSARRKAAKRRRRRLGLAVLPIASRPPASTPRHTTAKIENKIIVHSAPLLGKLAPSSSSSAESTSSDTSSSAPDTDSSSSSSDSETSSEDSASHQRNEITGQADMAKQGQPIEISEEHLSGLPLCCNLPIAGDVFAYKLLEIGEDYAPRISEVRLGKVISVEGDSSPALLTLEPYPDPSVHPLQHKKIVTGEGLGEEDEADREEPPCNYDEAGILTTELTSFAELRYYPSKAAGRTTTTATGVMESLPEQKKDLEALGPQKYSQLGPPRGAGQHSAVAASSPTGGDNKPAIISLLKQLQQRRAELSLTPEATVKKSTEKSPDRLSGAQGSARVGGEKKKSSGPRRAMQSAIGPTLRILRSHSSAITGRVKGSPD